MRELRVEGKTYSVLSKEDLTQPSGMYGQGLAMVMSGSCRFSGRSAEIPLFHQFLISKPLEGFSRIPSPMTLT